MALSLARELSVRYDRVSRWYLLITLTVLPRSRTLGATASRRMHYHSRAVKGNSYEREFLLCQSTL